MREIRGNVKQWATFMFQQKIIRLIQTATDVTHAGSLLEWNFNKMKLFMSKFLGVRKGIIHPSVKKQ